MTTQAFKPYLQAETQKLRKIEQAIKGLTPKPTCSHIPGVLSFCCVPELSVENVWKKNRCIPGPIL